MTSSQALTRVDPIGTVDIEALSADPLFDQLLNEIVSENPDKPRATPAAAMRDNDPGKVILGRLPERVRLQRRLALAAAVVVVVIGGAALSTGLSGSDSGLVTTPWNPARALPGNGESIAGNPAIGSWELVGDVVSTGWQQNTAGPPPANITCPDITACYALAGDYATPYVHAHLLSESLYVTGDLGHTWSVLPMPNGFDPTSGLTCADSSTCSAGGTLSGRSVFVTTTDSGHQWTIIPLTVPSGYQLFELNCSSESACRGVVGPSWAAQYMTKGVGLLTGRPPQELFVTTSNAGRTWASTPFLRSYWVSTLACPEASNCVVMGISKVAYEPVSKQQLDEYPAATRNKIPKHYPDAVGYFVQSTKNGGTTWQSGTLPHAAGFPIELSCATPSDCAALDLTTIPNPSPCLSNGNVPGGESSCFGGTTVVVSDVVTTSDGGATWQGRTFPPTVPLPAMSGLYCPSGNECWVTGSEAVPQVIGRLHDGGSSVILHTTDGGLTWSRTTFAVPAGAPNPYGQSFASIRSISCPTSTTCVALGDSAQSAKTTPVYSYVGQK